MILFTYKLANKLLKMYFDFSLVSTSIESYLLTNAFNYK